MKQNKYNTTHQISLSAVNSITIMSNKKYTELFEDIEDDISMGWSELCFTQKDMKKLSLTKRQNWIKFSVELTYQDRTIQLTCYENGNIVDFNEVFESLVTEVRSVYESSFPDFCANYGYDNDSIKALNIYKICKKQKKKLLYLLGEETFKMFMECEFDV